MDTQQLLHQLVKQQFPETIEDNTLQNYKTYFLRILNVRTGITLMDDSEIQAEIMKIQNKSQIYRLQDLLNRLSKSRLRKKNELLHFLFRISQLINNQYTNQTMDTLFKSQEIQSHIIQPKIIKKQIEEIPGNEDNLNLIKQITDKGNMQISENDLIKDLIFSIQGIESLSIIYDPVNDSFQVKKDIAINAGSRKLINTMCECGWLFKKIQSFTQQNYNSLVLQALQNSIKEELNEYYRLIAYFEQLQSEQTLTLRKMYLWLKQPMHHLLQINLVLSQIQTNVQLGTTSSLTIGILSRYSKHGCPQTSQLFQRILHQTTIPIMRFINQWIFDGSLNDQANEFFVERNENASKIRDSGELWKNEFKVNQDKIPFMITLEDSYKIYDTGRVINWLRKQCRFQQFNNNFELITVDILGTEQFSQFVNNVNQQYNKQLIQIIKPNFKITLQAIKRFLLLGQGEFIHTLMELLQNELNKPAQQVYRHTLLSLLESSFKNISQEVRLNVKLLEPSQNDTGWEIFCLDYTIEEPLNTIFNNKIMLQYYRIFNFLWRIKRVEYTLTQCWKMHQKFNCQLTQNVRKAIQLSYQMMNEMQHFIKNFYSYIMLEAIESSWKKFIDETDKIHDLDSLIKIHESFIQNILDRSFLNNKGEQTQKLLIKLFDHILRFKSGQELLLSFAQLSQTDDQQSLRNILGKQNPKTQVGNLDIIKSLTDQRKQYRDQMFDLLEKLRKEDRLKFLHFKLDFNEYYQGICESKLFNIDLEKFIGLCLPKTNNNNNNESRLENFVKQDNSIIRQDNSIIRQDNSIIRQDNSILRQDNNFIRQENNYIRQENNYVRQDSNLNRNEIFQPKLDPKKINKNIPQTEFHEQVRSVKEGLRQLEEQRRQQLQLKEQFIKSPIQKSPLQKTPIIQPTLTEHEKMKNDEDLDSSDDE